jgi:hypothetical protein
VIKKWRDMVDWWKRHHVKDNDEFIALHHKYKDVFGTPDGMDVLADLCKRNHVFDNTVFAPGDPGTTQFKEGRREAVMRILTFMENDPEEAFKRQQEQNHETTA